MITRKDILKHVKENYDTSSDYPFKKFPEYATLRHQSNEKWYGLIMNVLPEKVGLDGKDQIDILNLKCPPEISDTLRNGKSMIHVSPPFTGIVFKILQPTLIQE